MPISIGAKQQPVVELTSGDWEGIYADNNGYVREAVGGPTGGHWHILVEQPGEYEFTLRRWPEQTKAALGDKYEPIGAGEQAEEGAAASRRSPPAKLDIAGVKATTKADPKATGATLTVEAAAGGQPTLKAWFTDADGKELCGAFFVTVRRSRTGILPVLQERQLLRGQKTKKPGRMAGLRVANPRSVLLLPAGLPGRFGDGPVLDGDIHLPTLLADLPEAFLERGEIGFLLVWPLKSVVLNFVLSPIL